MTYNELLKELFLNSAILSSEDADRYLRLATDNGTPLYVELLKNENIHQEEIFKALASFYNVEFMNVQLVELNFELIDKYPRTKLIEYKVLPFSEDNKSVLFLVADPLKIDDIEEFKIICQKDLKFAFITPDNMNSLINYFDNKIQQKSVISEYTDNEEITQHEDITIDAPIIKLCDSILKDAVSRKASDIHIEPFAEEITLRYRIDGKLSVIDRMKTSIFQAILARFKIMSEMNIAERRIPQDGKINMNIDGNDYDFRVSTIPTINGEKIVIRIFNRSLSSKSMENLGFNKREVSLIKEMITRPHGIILLTGPTGSGKSTTLYTFLRYLNNEQTNIITVEDPVENQIAGINQVQVNNKANLTFASALRSILRQDPNIVMIGEIRDEETAQIATRAAITGHLVLSTIHTNSAAGVVSRLVNMGVPPYLVADSLLGSISQRLVRKLCPKCKKEHMTTEAENKLLGLKKSVMIYEPVGCPTCNHTGYSGRTGVFEIMVCDEDVRKTIMNDEFTTEMLTKQVEDTTVNLLDRCKERVLEGETSIEEYNDLNEVIKKTNQ